MKETKTILVIVALLTIASIAYVAMYPYLTPENIQITPNRGPLDLGTSIGFIITGHLHSRSTTFTYNWQISNLGINLTYGGGSMMTDFYGDFNPILTPWVHDFQIDTLLQIEIIINESGRIIQQNMTVNASELKG